MSGTEPTRGRVTASGLEVEFLELGSGPLALCLHGFPDSPYTWQGQMAALAEAGYHVVAPWMRGFFPSQIPGDGRYQLGALVADALALHDVLDGDEKAVLIGHDLGAYAAYGAAAHEPERFRRLATLAVPPLPVAGAALAQFEHARSAWHLFFFQSALAPTAVAADDFAFIDRLWRQWSPDYDGGEFIARAKETLVADGHLDAVLGIYRAMFDTSTHAPELEPQQAALLQPTRVPTLYLHGDRDGMFGVGASEGAEDLFAPGSARVVVEGAGHFLQLERPDLVTAKILEFLAKAY